MFGGVNRKLKLTDESEELRQPLQETLAQRRGDIE